MPKRKEFEQQVWQAFVEACGNRCNVCLKEDVRLESGHLLSDADGGSSTLDNLVPICRSCNASNRDGLTQDMRPSGWRDKFAKLLLTKFGIGLTIKISDYTESQSVALKTDATSSQVAENTRPINWHEVAFVKANSLLLSPTDRLALTEAAAESLVEEMILAGRKSDLRAPPLMQRKGRLIRLARFGRENFTAACESFFYQKPWAQFGYGDAWAFLCDNFGMYVSEGLDARKRKQERSRLAHAEETRSRWSVYQRAAECGDWPGMSGADRAFRDAAKAEKDAPIRELSAEEFARADALPGKEFRAKKKQIEGFISLCEQMARVSNDSYSTDYVRDCLLAARTVSDLRMVHELVSELHQMLRVEIDPASPNLDDF